MFHKFLFTSVLSIICLIAGAQSLQLWTWDYYKMTFKAPDNMVVSEKDVDGYQASNNSITLDIYPRKGENLTYDGMKNAIVKWANQVSLSYTNTSSGET